MFIILNEEKEVVSVGHKTQDEVRAWIRWALTVRPGVKYTAVTGTDEELAKVLTDAAERAKEKANTRESMTLTSDDVGTLTLDQ